MCPICKNTATPVIYGQVTPDLIDLSKQGTVIIGDINAIDKPSWYCEYCTEAF